jgi:hypothetical protein
MVRFLKQAVTNCVCAKAGAMKLNATAPAIAAERSVFERLFLRFIEVD